MEGVIGIPTPAILYLKLKSGFSLPSIPWRNTILEMEEINPVHTQPRIFIKHCSFWSCYFCAQNPSIISSAYGINSNILVWHSRSFKIWSIEALQPDQSIWISVYTLHFLPPLCACCHGFLGLQSFSEFDPILQGLLKCYLFHEV